MQERCQTLDISEILRKTLKNKLEAQRDIPPTCRLWIIMIVQIAPLCKYVLQHQDKNHKLHFFGERGTERATTHQVLTMTSLSLVEEIIHVVNGQAFKWLQHNSYHRFWAHSK